MRERKWEYKTQRLGLWLWKCECNSFTRFSYSYCNFTTTRVYKQIQINLKYCFNCFDCAVCTLYCLYISYHLISLTIITHSLTARNTLHAGTKKNFLDLDAHSGIYIMIFWILTPHALVGRIIHSAEQLWWAWPCQHKEKSDHLMFMNNKQWYIPVKNNWADMPSCKRKVLHWQSHTFLTGPVLFL